MRSDIQVSYLPTAVFLFSLSAGATVLSNHSLRDLASGHSRNGCLTFITDHRFREAKFD